MRIIAANSLQLSFISQNRSAAEIRTNSATLRSKKSELILNSQPAFDFIPSSDSLKISGC
jgi:hypothetical protein